MCPQCCNCDGDEIKCDRTLVLRRPDARRIALERLSCTKATLATLNPAFSLLRGDLFEAPWISQAECRQFEPAHPLFTSAIRLPSVLTPLWMPASPSRRHPPGSQAEVRGRWVSSTCPISIRLSPLPTLDRISGGERRLAPRRFSFSSPVGESRGHPPT